MIIDVILGVNIDTMTWIKNLKLNEVENIVVIDYDVHDFTDKRDNVLFMSPDHARKYLSNGSSLNFYKSVYIYPTGKKI